MTVNGTIARVIVTQRFENPLRPLARGHLRVSPARAVGGRCAAHGDRLAHDRGRDQGPRRGQQLYEAAKDDGQKASLVEQERPNIFTNSVANIGPHESIVIRIEYQETVKQDGGVLHPVRMTWLRRAVGIPGSPAILTLPGRCNPLEAQAVTTCWGR